MTRIIPTIVAACSALMSLGADAALHASESPLAGLKVPSQLTPKQFAGYHALVLPAAGESPWRHIAWQASVWEARQQAATEGKPILIWSGGGAPPLGVC